LYATVSKGTYVRAIVHDLGEKLGVGAVATKILRTRHGVFNLEDCLPEEDWNFEAIVRKMYANRELFDRQMQLLAERRSNSGGYREPRLTAHTSAGQPASQPPAWLFEEDERF
jgi:tRNA U55 pseudouridine synthase TruB